MKKFGLPAAAKTGLLSHSEGTVVQSFDMDMDSTQMLFFNTTVKTGDIGG